MTYLLAFQAPFVLPVLTRRSERWLYGSPFATILSLAQVTIAPPMHSECRLQLREIKGHGFPSFSAFYDGNFKSSQAGDFLSNIVLPGLRAACPGKHIYITELVTFPSFWVEHALLIIYIKGLAGRPEVKTMASQFPLSQTKLVHCLP